MGHNYSSLQLTYAFKTHTKHAKMHEMYKLVIFAAVLSAADKLQRLAICIIYKFKYKNSNTHTSMEAPPRPDMFEGGGESFKMAALLSEWCERLWNWATTVDMCHVLHLHTNTIGTFVNYTLLTYLLNSENFIVRTNSTFATETHPWPNMLFGGPAATRWWPGGPAARRRRALGNGTHLSIHDCLWSLLLRFPLWRDRGSVANAP